MVAALSMLGSSVVDSHTSPCLCLDSLPTINSKTSGGYHLVLYRNQMGKKRFSGKETMVLSSSFVDSWHEWRLSGKMIIGNFNRSLKRRQGMGQRLVTVSELAGQYEDSFEDVKTQLLNYFTYKAVRTVMNQLYEMNPLHYRWLYNFVTINKPGDGKRFLRTLVKERQDLAERVMVTRLHLYGKWVKKCDHGAMYKEISEENLQLMRERLMETVIWPTDDTNTEKIG